MIFSRLLVFSAFLLLTLVPRVFAIDPLVEKLLSRNYNDRKDALDELQKMGSFSRNAFIPDLIQGLGVSDPVAASWAGDALRIIGAEAVPAIIEVMRMKQDGGNFAVMTLAGMKSTAIPALQTILNGSDSTLKYQALLVLREMGGRDAGAAVSEAGRMLTDPDFENRQIAAQAIGKMGVFGAGALSQLVKALDDDSPAFRNQVVLAIGQMRASADSAVPRLVSGLSDTTHPLDDEFVRGALESIGTAQARSALETMGVDQAARDKYESRHPNQSLDTRRSGSSKFESRQTTQQRNRVR